MNNRKPPAPRAHLVNELAGQREVRFAIAVVAVSALFFLAAVFYARTPLPKIAVFMPIYVTALVVCDLITAVLLFGQYRALLSRPLLVLAAAYLFTACITAAYALIFPGLFAPTGLLGSGSQTSSAMYMMWHAGFVLGVMAYTSTQPVSPDAADLRRHVAAPPSIAIGSTVLGVLVLVGLLTALATRGHDLLPVFLMGHSTTPTGKAFLIGIWLLSFLALWQLWRRRPHTGLDVWLQVVMCVWIFDIALAAVLNTGRYDLGWYAGRIYGLLAACFLLIMLLVENARHYAQLVQVSAELRSANDSLWQVSLQDGLTELANRRAFDTYIREQRAVSLRHKRPLALILIDIDHFKPYNDRYGHQAGDDALQRVAAAIEGCCQRPSDMSARYGGEEFALLLPDTDESGALHMADAVLEAVERLQLPHEDCSTGPVVSVSCGVAVQTIKTPWTVTELIERADQALYQAKALGRKRVVCEQASERASVH